MKSYRFLYEFDQLETRYASGELLISCQKLQNALSKNGVSDIDAKELFDELRIIGRMIKENKPTARVIDILNMIVKSQLENLLPNAVVAYRILLTIPVSVATGERTFSKLKIIKTYLRNSMTNNRLSDLAIMSIEKDLTKRINYDDVITDFVNAKARKFGII